MAEVARIPGTQSDQERTAEARRIRARFAASVNGAKLRARDLPRNLVGALAFAAANRALIAVVNGEVKFKSAAEAAQVAKAAAEVGRLELGEGAGAPISEDERKAKVAQLRDLMKAIDTEAERLEQSVVDGSPGPIQADAAQADTA